MIKNIYELELHESVVIRQTGEGYPVNWQVTKVHNGWLYMEDNPNITRMPMTFFVPQFNESYTTNEY